MYEPAMSYYSLPALAVDSSELATIQSNVLAIMLQKLGISSKLPTAIRHGPVDVGGVALTDLRTETGIEAIKLLRNNVYANIEVGKLLQLNMSYSQREAGIGYPLLERLTTYISYLTPTWITSVRHFLSLHCLTITCTDQPPVRLRTKADQFIMAPEHLVCYSAKQQLDINLVRMFLQATSLYDLSAGTDGKTTQSEFLKGERPGDFVADSGWPCQQVPTGPQCRLWKDFISTNFIRYPPYWKTPLGSLLPLDSYSNMSSNPLATPLPPTKYASLKQFLKAIPRFYNRLLSFYEQLATDVQVFCAFLSRRRLEIISDGSLEYQSLGTFGWKIITNKEVVLFHRTGPVGGPPETASSARSELGGYAAPLLLIAAIARFWGRRHRCQYRWIVDSQAAISNVILVTRRGSTPFCQLNNTDYLTLIYSLQTELRRRPKITWVKGHQDQDIEYSKLSRDARNNVDVDHLASTHTSQHRLAPSQSIPHQPLMRVSITAGGVRMVGNFDAHIRYHINGSPLRVYMQRRFQWSDTTWDLVDLFHFRAHICSLQPSQQITHMKLVHDQQPVGIRLLQRAPVKDPTIALCPCCDTHTETQRHLLRCPSNPELSPLTCSFSQNLHASESYAFFYLIIAGILQWLQSDLDPTPVDLRGYPSHMHEAIKRHGQSRQQSGGGWP